MRHLVSVSLCFAFLIAEASIAAAVTPQVRAIAAKKDVLIAETFSFRVEVIAERGCRIEFTEPISEGENAMSQLGVFDILATADLEDVPLQPATEDHRLWSRTYTLETIRLGEQTIPAISVTVSRDGQSQTLQTNPIVITVGGVIEKTDEPLREIAGTIQREPEPDAPSDSSRFAWLAGVLLVTAILAASVSWYRRRGSEPLRWCTEELIELRIESESFTTDVDATRWLDFAQRLREILRVALSAYLHEPYPSQSTSRLIQECQRVAPESGFQSCEDVFSRADRLKFGDQGTDPSLNQEVVARSSRAVEETERMVEFVRQPRRDRKRGR